MDSLLTLPEDIHLPGTPEHFSPLLTSDSGLLVERIVSWGHVTPEDQWYDQEKDEWVLLLEGSARLGFDEILLDWFLYPTSGDQTALDLPADKTGVLKDFAQALEKQLPEGTVLSVVLRETPAADNGLTPEMLTACFDRVYVMPEADASALPTSYDAATRVVAMTAYAPDSGSYLVTQ